MSIVLVGLNHKTAPVEVREQLALTDEVCRRELQTLVDGEIIREALIVSTCNRVEVLTATGGIEHADGLARINAFLTKFVRQDVFSKHFYTHANEEAIRHLFRVASSLDSMVVGEAQILGQVRRAYTQAVAAGTTGRVLHRLLHHALHVAKRVRTETGIAASSVSISYTAVELARKVFGSLGECSVLLVGAGEMAELAARHLQTAGAHRIAVANRTTETAHEVARKFDGEAVDYAQLAAQMADADIVICSTGARDEYVITTEMARSARERKRHKRPTFLIDISVPRNIDPAVGELDDFFVFDIDDLEAVIASNIREREREAERAELIIESEVLQFQQSLRALKLGPTVGALKQKMQAIAEREYARQRPRLGDLTPAQEKAIEALLLSTVNKISHPVINRLRRSYDTGAEENLQAWRDVFGLDE